MTIVQTNQSGIGLVSHGTGYDQGYTGRLTETQTGQGGVEGTVGTPELAEGEDTLAAKFLVHTSLGENL